MRVIRCGDSPGVRLPAAVIEAFNPGEGDGISIEVADPRHFRIARDGTPATIFTRRRE